MARVVGTEEVESKPVKSYLAATFAIATIVGLTACTQPAIEVMDTDSELQGSEVEGEEVQELHQLEIPETVSPQAVVLAAFIMANGDILKAIEAGLVTPEEAQLAEEALATSSLQLWVDAAQQK